MSEGLYPWQEMAVAEVMASLQENPCLVAPTGGGKTSMAAELTRLLGLRTVFIAHRNEILDQAHKRLKKSGVVAGRIQVGEPVYPQLSVQVASKDRLARRPLPWIPELFIVDEAHHSAARTWERILQEYSAVPRIGLTATPFRMDQKPLNHLYGKLVIASHFDDLVGEGLLVDPTVKSIGKANREGIPIRGGEYRAADVEERMNTGVLVGDCVDTWLKLAKGRRTLMYASGVKHSLHLVEEFRKAGVKAEHVDGKTKKKVREGAVERLERGEIDILSNVDVFTEGTDIPSVEVAVIARIYNSLTTHLQIGGRVVRACPGKEGAIILDHGGNYNFHGLLSQRLIYSLDGDVEKVEKEKPVVCPQCSLVLPKELSFECPACGWKAPPASTPPGEGRELPLQVPGELVDYESLRVDIPFPVRKAYWDEVEKLRVLRGYAEGWSWWRYVARFKEKPVLAGRRLIDPKTATDDEKYLFWRGLEERRHEKAWKPGWTGYQYKRVFGQWPRWRAA